MFKTSRSLARFAAIPAFALLLSVGFVGAAPAATVGQPAPAFSAPAVTGDTVTLEDFKGKVVVLEWHNKDCPFVRKHYDSKNMQNLQKELTGKGVVWLTINSSAEGQQGYETADAAKQTLASEGAAPTHYLLDTDGTVGKLYDAKTTPHMFVIDKDGTLAYAGAIDDKASTYVSDVPEAKNYVRAAVDSLEKGEAVAETSTKAYGCGVKYAK